MPRPQGGGTNCQILQASTATPNTKRSESVHRTRQVTTEPHGEGIQTARTGKLAVTRIWPTALPPLPAFDGTSIANRSALAEAPASPALRPHIPFVVPPKTRKEHRKSQKNEDLAPHCVSVRVFVFRLLHQSRRTSRASWQLRCGFRAPRIDDGYPLSPKPSRA